MARYLPISDSTSAGIGLALYHLQDEDLKMVAWKGQKGYY